MDDYSSDPSNADVSLHDQHESFFEIGQTFTSDFVIPEDRKQKSVIKNAEIAALDPSNRLLQVTEKVCMRVLDLLPCQLINFVLGSHKHYFMKLDSAVSKPFLILRLETHKTVLAILIVILSIRTGGGTSSYLSSAIGDMLERAKSSKVSWRPSDGTFGREMATNGAHFRQKKTKICAESTVEQGEDLDENSLFQQFWMNGPRSMGLKLILASFATEKLSVVSEADHILPVHQSSIESNQ